MKKMELSTQKHGYKLIFCIGVFVSGKLKEKFKIGGYSNEIGSET